MRICRICLGNLELSDIFDPDENIASNIMLIASVQVIKGDALPQKICNLCKVELDISLNFKNKCELSYQTFSILRPTLNKNNPIKIDNKDSLVKSKTSTSIPFKCLQCDIKFTSLSAYELHKRRCKHTCSICNRHFEYKNTFSHHLQSAHDILMKKVKQCEFCGKSFRFNVELSRHMIVHSGIKQFQCNICLTYLASKSGLNKHIAKHNTIRKFHCLHCDKKFVHQSNLHEHLKVHISEKKYKCTICTKTFKAKRTLILHTKIHNNDRNFPCTQCEKAFTNKFDQLRHTKLHGVKIDSGMETTSKQKQGQCEVCGKFCGSLSDLQKHIRVHTGETPFPCLYCERAFKTISSRNCHMRIHTKKKPYICQYCGKDFSQSSNLHTHEVIHSSIKPHNCTTCSQSFNRKRDLLRHMKRCTKTTTNNKSNSECDSEEKI